jgi:hypothetical protein
MKRRRFRRRATRAILRLVEAYEASFRQLFGGFLNVKGFYRVFIPVLGSFCLIHNTNKTKSFWASVWVSNSFSGEFFLSILSFLNSCFVISVLVLLWLR